MRVVVKFFQSSFEVSEGSSNKGIIRVRAKTRALKEQNTWKTKPTVSFLAVSEPRIFSKLPALKTTFSVGIYRKLVCSFRHKAVNNELVFYVIRSRSGGHVKCRS